MSFIPLESLDNQFGINEQSQVINFKTGHILSPYIGIDNYQHLTIKKDGQIYRKRVHRLMAEAFFDNAEVIDHINGNKADNRLENLQPTTHSANIAKAYKEQTYKNPHPGRGIWLIITNIKTGEVTNVKSMREAERITGVDRHRIKTFLEKTRNNYTDYIFEYDE